MADNRWLKEVMNSGTRKEEDRELNDRNPGRNSRERRGRIVDGYRIMTIENWKTSVMLRNRDT
jgi:hypothetical protein